MIRRLRLRVAGPQDRPFLAELSARVFAAYGDFGERVPHWLSGPGVRGQVGLAGGRRVGFTLTSLVRLPGDGDVPEMAVDLMVLAVTPEAQGHGVGRWMLDSVLGDARRMAAETDRAVRAVTLTVAEDNARAWALFRSAGFVPTRDEVGTYPRGQVACRMILPLPLPARRPIVALGLPPAPRWR